jgi:hypothetical protein
VIVVAAAGGTIECGTVAESAVGDSRAVSGQNQSCRENASAAERTLPTRTIHHNTALFYFLSFPFFAVVQCELFPESVSVHSAVVLLEE